MISFELEATQEHIKNVTGDPPLMFRPPFGLKDPRLLLELKRHKLVPVLWSITSWDWTCPGSEEIVDVVMRKLHPGSIVLFHDGAEKSEKPERTDTIEAVKKIIPLIREQGYRFVGIDLGGFC
jgi:peptidoglycan/xylan/chitin deacetylase (PgdA/CDA1 family)